MSSHRVTRLSVTPVKGMRVQHPDEIALGPEGAVGNRVFCFADAGGRLLSVPRLGALVRFTASFDAESDRLAVRHDDGRVCEGEVRLGAAVTIATSTGREIRGNVVEGPWTAFLEEVAAQPLRLVKAERPARRPTRPASRCWATRRCARWSANPASRASIPGASGC